MGFMFGGGFEILFFLVFFLILGTFIVMVVRNLMEWNSNNHSPRLTVAATVVAKRVNVSHHHHSGGPNSAGHTTHSTSYYVTFEVESGDRMEFHVRGSEYGMLAEGDFGQLSFQGTRYLEFLRQY